MAETRITLDEFRSVLVQKFTKHGMGQAEAEKTADIFTYNAADGVISHSVLRVCRLVKNLDDGIVVPGAMPSKVSGFGGVERYQANDASGVIAASFCMEQACELAKEHGIGMVALRHANHWMRGGYYGWLAADKGFVALCWTNTKANMPSWGSKVSNIGNNPFIMAVPCKDGNHLVLDSAMAQFSNGKLEVTRRAGKLLPVAGGYDKDGNLTTVPGDIEATKRAIPMGFWKGSSMSMLLDSSAALLSDGYDTSTIERSISARGSDECLLSQVFIAIDPRALGPNEFEKIEQCLRDNVHNAQPVTEGVPSRCPGERVISDRAKAKSEGVMVPEEAWNQIQAL